MPYAEDPPDNFGNCQAEGAVICRGLLLFMIVLCIFIHERLTPNGNYDMLA